MTSPISPNRFLESLKEAAGWPGHARAHWSSWLPRWSRHTPTGGESVLPGPLRAQPRRCHGASACRFFQVLAGHDVAAAITKLDKAATMDVGLPQYFRGLALAELLPGGGLPEAGLAAADRELADQVIADLELVLAVRDQFPAILLRAAYQGLARAYAVLGRQQQAAEACDGPASVRTRQPGSRCSRASR